MKLQLPRDVYLPNYDSEKSKCSDFISTFTDTQMTEAEKDPIHGKLKYMIQLQKVANKEQSAIEIDMDDLKDFFDTIRDQGFLERIQLNTTRYIDLFSQCIDGHMPAPSIRIQEEDLTTNDIVMQQRRFNASQAHQQMVAQGIIRPGQDANAQIKNCIPPELERQYHVCILPGMNAKKDVVKMREIKANQVGSLVSVKGIVTRCSDVKPCIKVAVFACDACGNEVYQVINKKEFTPVVECPSQKCIKNNVKGQLILQVKQSKFVSFQEIKIQEPSNQVPIGHVPRQIKVIAKGPITRQCAPGDHVMITGIYMPSLKTGFAAMRSQLIHDTHIEAYKIVKDKQNFKEFMLSSKMLDKVNEVKNSYQDEKGLFDAMSRSICPEIFGMKEVKQALLLLMVGGVTKEMKDGMRIRGHINALLMGDPGVAKSQLLKHISGFAPRGIYTTGKGSSGVGLTAAVLKDPNTGEVVLEGGALVLADTGICCIDEFDKMDERDRTNIHEVMEQQTISIAKAGITTSLNARTSVLAAANPVYGRYNKKLKPHENINLPAALLSRFDMLFLLLDKADMGLDTKLAVHVTQVHQRLEAPTRSEIDQEVMRSFIAYAQTFNPTIPADLHNYIVARYVEKRKFQREGKEEASYMYITPRTLLAIIRISQAKAKFHFRDTVSQEDVDAAINLMDFSLMTLQNLNDSDGKSTFARNPNNEQRKNMMDTTINHIRKIMQNDGDKMMSIADTLKKLQRQDPSFYSAQKFNRENLKEVLNHYKKLNVIYISEDDQFTFL